MSGGIKITPEILSAFVDEQLPAAQRDEVAAALQADPALAEEVRQLRQFNRLAAQAYQEIPVPPLPEHLAPRRQAFMFTKALAAGLLLFLGGIAGWGIQQYNNPPHAPLFQEIARLDPVTLESSKILLHINTMDSGRVNAALDAAEQLLRENSARRRAVDLEIVANAEALALLREGSPYAERIQNMRARYSNLSFKACGIAMETAKLKEGVEIKLLPEAERVDAALNQILTRLRQGWTYIRA